MFQTAQIKELWQLDAVDQDRHRDRSQESWATNHPVARIVQTRRYVGQIFFSIAMYR